MTGTLLGCVRRHTEAHAGQSGYAATPLPGLATVRATAPSGLIHDLSRPLVCLVLQGGKQVTMGRHSVSFGAGDSLLITADVPTVSQITCASFVAPYLSFVLELDLAIVADLALRMQGAPVEEGPAVRIERTDGETADAALRLMRLVERSDPDPVLHALRLQEMHYWLMAGRLGPAIRRLGWPEGPSQRVARAIAVLRRDFARPLPVEALADVAGMSPSSFHRHFRAITSLSPLQFQKRLRLIEARRLMSAEGQSASSAAYAVGYESVPQFTREYGRMFGLSPVRDVERMRNEVRAAA
ncbi:AraC family transcriptional regulator [Siccirubricoccus sp. KC 17139]|uniref:AraC family transcriptional regulator n=1 Tax=Siccirubricoccus soli TaxID=2899147 RepID=A0ABT1DAI2_9PROT|nr:AraC family transcriptional regulator [Siccirubricoccus soli]MCO6418879.1 AraC family transcriptional regulator [Siccirubricoccus soli]MCP2685014.1 AraC family transcriptional regulator [Siccirubricoccus soli]